MTVVLPEDFQKNGYCMSGAKGWFAQHKLDFRDFIRNGVSAAVLRAAEPDGDIQVEQAIATAVAREAANG